ncbi:amino acid ABC transporter ATP-binding protein [Clostridium sp. BJN0001]|uniref:amino acid ABC transporter ATP-binding protein n=1 Tax=Clostridium sp. BJN0001 TaxID=2930219 RepID=UPI00246801ED|nr:amino acid ABC transporter ATP-binding protein [Clostridium sp. BJN0001]
MEDKDILIEIDDVKKKYDNNIEVLKGISLKVKKGEVIVILGPSGCGKSTFLRCINGLEKIQGGNIRFKDFNFNDKNINFQKVREKIGMVFQSYDLFPNMTVLENILLGPLKVLKMDKKEALKDAEKLLSKVGLLDRKNSYPRQLSGGQKQRIAIVRALIMKPEIMLFDEVTASLDPEMVREVLDVILDLRNRGMTMLIVTHEIAFAKAVADRIVFIDEGKICEESSPDVFFTNPKTERVKKFLNVFNYD